MRLVPAFVVLLVPASFAAALSFGSVDLPWSAIIDGLLARGDDINREIVWGLRMPRAAAAFACGALLAQAGALLQVLLRNPLADPYVLGVSGGAATGALAAMLWGAGAAAIHLSALAVATLAAGAIVVFAFRTSGWNAYRVILSGVALSAGFGALVSLLLTLAPAAQSQGMLFWLLGDFSGAENSAVTWFVLALCAALAQMLAPALDVLTLGDDKARSLGVNVTALQGLVFGCSTVATVAAVLTAGPIGFVGLVVPHSLRLVGCHRHRALMPLSALAGGSFLTVADTVARSAAPIELPAGALTALIGVPVFLWLLIRSR